jgi:hypothetical protein
MRSLKAKVITNFQNLNEEDIEAFRGFNSSGVNKYQSP